MLGLIWAESTDRFIGLDGTLPWRLPEGLARFRRLPSGHPVVMGRATWESLPVTARPLPGRTNVVLSRDRRFAGRGALVAHDVEHALAIVGGRGWVIGGREVIEAFAPHAERAEVTVIDVEAGRGVRAPNLPPDPRWRPPVLDPATGWALSRTGLRYRHLSYARIPDTSRSPR